MRRFVGALAALVALAWSAPVAASPELVVSAQGVSIGSIPGGGRLAVFGVVRRLSGTVPGFERLEQIVEDVDRDGVVEVALEEAADPAWSTWVAVDLASGEWGAVGRVEPGEEFVQGGLVPGGELMAGTAVWPLPEGILEVLVVRPGAGPSAGAWGGAVWDGGPADGDGLEDGSAGVALAWLEPVAASGPAPESFASGDVLVAIEPYGLGYGVATVAGVTQ